MKLGKIISMFKPGSIGKTDLGILKVAFMVAALDGDVTDAEFKAFEALAKKTKGATPKSIAAAREEAMRAAGYLMLLARRVSVAQLVKAFIAEAKAALPGGFANLSIEEIRRAIVVWIAMGLSDGDYSARERACIEALRRLFAELKVMSIEQEEYRKLALIPAYRQATLLGASSGTLAVITKDFVSRVEDMMALTGDDADAAKELKRLIADGE